MFIVSTAKFYVHIQHQPVFVDSPVTQSGAKINVYCEHTRKPNLREYVYVT